MAAALAGNEKALERLEEALSERYRGVAPHNITSEYANVEQGHGPGTERIGIVRLIELPSKKGYQIAFRRLPGSGGDCHLNLKGSEAKAVLEALPALASKLDVVRDLACDQVQATLDQYTDVQRLLDGAVLEAESPRRVEVKVLDQITKERRLLGWITLVPKFNPRESMPNDIYQILDGVAQDMAIRASERIEHGPGEDHQIYYCRLPTPEKS